MIDIKKFRENPQIYKQWAKAKGVAIDWERFEYLDEQIRLIQKQVDDLKMQRNQVSKQIGEFIKKGEADQAEKVKQQADELKRQIEDKQAQYENLKEEWEEILYQIPAPPLEDVPLGKDDSENVEIARVGVDEFSKKIEEIAKKMWKNLPNEPLPHWEILEKRDMLDSQRWAKVSWSRFVYLKDWLVLLELALIQWAVHKLYQKWFRPINPPNLVRERAMFTTWFFPADKNEIYHVNPEDDNLFLIWTAEVPLVSQHIDEVIDVDDLPLRYVWISPAYRREAGSYGKDIKGLIRLHQFEKVEMVSFVKPEDSPREHELMLSIEEEIYQDLKIPYRKLLICSWDLWAPAAKKYDLEAWLPGMQAFKEITSTSNTVDFQARRGNIKYKVGNQKDFVHTLNWTVVALQRTMVAIVENYQTDDMRIIVPEVLKPYMGGMEII